MPGCCDPRGCDRVFGPRFARRQAAAYRKRGLSRTARRLVERIEERGVRGRTVLEIGGGVGEIQLELLRRGAASTTNLELSPGYEDEARRLLDDAGLTGRVQRRIADIAADPGAVEPADVVVLHRVVCCYPDQARLLGAAADHAREQLVFSHPPRNVASRAVVGSENLMFRLAGREYRTFAHDPGAMYAVVRDHGMEIAPAHRGFAWHVADAVR